MIIEPCLPVRIDITIRVGYISVRYSTCVKQPLSERPNIGKTNYRECRSKGEHSAILSTFIKLPFGIKISVLSFF